MGRKLSIVIQGPLNRISIDNIVNYNKFGKVIVSCWSSDDLSLLQNVECPFWLVYNPVLDWNKIYNKQNVAKQAISTYNGMQLADSEFVVKVRSDESYSDLSKLIDKLEKTPNKLITNNIFFKPDHIYKFHPSDHLVAGRTALMNMVYRLLCQYVTVKYETATINSSGRIELPDCRGKMWEAVAEQLLAACAIEILGIKVLLEKSKEITKRVFDMIHISELGDVIWTANYLGQKYCGTSETKVPESINSMDEL